VGRGEGRRDTGVCGGGGGNKTVVLKTEKKIIFYFLFYKTVVLAYADVVPHEKESALQRWAQGNLKTCTDRGNTCSMVSVMFGLVVNNFGPRVRAPFLFSYEKTVQKTRKHMRKSGS
jgi:hypothetical protein